ncbi:hypothetical protein FA13DRAFT_1707000 [Coprinellus micaceus]|uniref:Uncharacterized protein n=1 Tax=Coprinellus micaceus TaxID=71717 RepID=A0A4Y7TNL3_COPMI|nr:hypothetical protein FA13DRAFT_1707000 [Coprinellus micaceus]
MLHHKCQGPPFSLLPHLPCAQNLDSRLRIPFHSFIAPPLIPCFVCVIGDSRPPSTSQSQIKAASNRYGIRASQALLPPIERRGSLNPHYPLCSIYYVANQLRVFTLASSSSLNRAAATCAEARGPTGTHNHYRGDHEHVYHEHNEHSVHYLYHLLYEHDVDEDGNIYPAYLHGYYDPDNHINDIRIKHWNFHHFSDIDLNDIAQCADCEFSRDVRSCFRDDPGGASSSTPVNGATRANGGVTPTSTTKADSTGASKKSFWDNKGAVAGVFVLISVVVLALLALLWRALARRRAAARQKRLTAQLFGGKYAESDFAPSNNGHSNSGAAAYGDVESSRGGNDTRFQGAPITVGASASDNPFEPNAQYGATSSNPWSPPPVASTSRVSPETGVSTGYQPPHSAASTYETAQSHYYTPAGSEQSHNHYASNVPAVTVTSPQQYLPPSHISASASSLSAYSNDPSASAPPTAFKGLGGAGDRVSYDSFYGGKAL